MRALIKLDIDYGYRSVGNIAKYFDLPDGLYGPEGLDTEIELFPGEEFESLLYVESFNLKTGVSVLQASGSLNLSKRAGLDEPEALEVFLQKLVDHGWEPSFEPQGLVDIVTAEKASKLAEDELVSRMPPMPTRRDYALIMAVVIIISLVWYGFKADFNIGKIEWVGMVMHIMFVTVVAWGISIYHARWKRKKFVEAQQKTSENWS